MYFTKRLIRVCVLFASLFSGTAWAAGSVTDISGVEDGPALSSYAARGMSLGFSDLHNVNGEHAQSSDLSFSVLDGDGNPVSFQMDPITGETRSPAAGSK